MRVSRLYPCAEQIGADGCGIKAEPVAYLLEGETRFVEVPHLTDLVIGWWLASQFDAFSFEHFAYRDAIDAVLVGKLVDGLSRLVTRNDSSSLLGRNSRAGLSLRGSSS